MSRRRTYRNQDQEPVQSSGDGSSPPSPPPPAPSPSFGVLKWILATTAGAVLGAVAVDYYRGFKEKVRNKKEAEEPQNISMTGALPGAPNIMPFPMPFPMPMSMPQPPPYVPYAPAPSPAAPLSEDAQLELARIKMRTAEAEAMREQMRAWEDD